MIEALLFMVLMLVIGGIAWIGQWGRTDRIGRYIVYGAIGLFGFLLMAIGALFLIAASITNTADAPALPPNTGLTGWLLVAMGACAIPSLVPAIRRLLSKTVFPGLEPDLSVHAWALFIFLSALLLTSASITILYDPEMIVRSLQDVPLYMTAAFNALNFVVFSLIASGIWIYRPFKETVKNLGLTGLPKNALWQLIGFALVLTVFIQVVEWLLMPLVSDQMKEQLHQIMNALQTHGGVWYTVMAGIIVGLSAGIGEEILFRGLVQPVFGIFPTTLLFTLIHTHYGPTVLLLELFLVGLVLGYVRKRWNTTAAIIVHAGFDFFAITSSLVFPSG